MAGQFTLPTRDDNVSAWLEAATVLFRATLLKCLPLAMAAVLLAQLPSLYWIATGNKLDGKLPQDPVYWVLYAVGVAAYLLFIAALVVRQQQLRAGQEPPTVLIQLRAATQRWPALALATLGAGGIVALGLLALLIPGIYLAVCMLPLTAIAVLEPIEPVAAIRRSVVLIRPIWVKVFASVLIAVLVVIVCIIAAGAVIAIFVALFAERDSATSTALVSACMLIIQAVALAFFSALSLTIYSAASSSA